MIPLLAVSLVRVAPSLEALSLQFENGTPRDAMTAERR
jgi:hypothetical protein